MNFVTKTQLQDIVEYIGDSIHVPQLVQHFDKTMIYSTDEKIVGCWIDGRPLYQKTIEFTMPTNTDVKTILTLGSTYKVIKIDGIEHPTDGGAIEIPWCLNTSANNWTFVFQDLATGNICVNIGENVAANFKGCSAYVTILYYKTTDAANSFKWADENDYSTTEKIIGTWIDGKPVYQRCFVLTNSITLVPDQFLSISEVTIQNARNIKMQLNLNSGGGNSFAIDAKIQDDHPSIRYTGSTSGLTIGAGAVLICQYTKTTD